MNKAQVKLELNELITIDNTVYHVAEHPALPGVAYIQRGARGFVIQLKSPGPERYALKYFKLKYRVPELVGIGKALRQYSDVPGLRAAYRTVFTTPTHPDLIRRYPALEYGVLMPWLPGTTWFDVITRRVALSPLESLELAQAAAHVLATLEAKGLAHCDIAGANVMVDRANHRVELVDIEEMYGPNLPRPVELPAGQDGYQHKQSAEHGQWLAAGDRFGAAVLIAEMLGWQSARIRDNSADEHFFAASEMQQPASPRFVMLRDQLRADYAPVIGDVFEAAWRSPNLTDCPPLTTWQAELDKLSTPTSGSVSLPSSSIAPTVGDVVSGRRSLLPTTSTAPAPPFPPTAANTSAATTPAAPVGRLCPRCGAQNTVNADFCQKCHYYLRSDKRAARSAMPSHGGPTQPGSWPPPINLVPNGAAAPEIVSARRMVAPGQVGQVVPVPEPPGPEGRWIVAAIVIAVVLGALVLALVAAH